ncbi:MAG: response regulator [Myxococcota bacterium]|nr:response regulator [Myxococcota bacterium]
MPTVLIADDMRVERMILKAHLTKWGYDIIETDGGEAALKYLLKPDGPQMAILDWVMPGMTGPEVVRIVRSQRKNAYVYCILLTALGSKADIIEGLQAGADDYVTKPVNADELQVRLNGAQRLIGALEAQRLSELKMQALLDSAGDAILITDPDGRIESANPHAERLFASTEESVIGKSVLDFIDDLAVQEILTEHLLAVSELEAEFQSRNRRREISVRRGDGGTAVVAIKVSRLTPDDSSQLSIFMTDITEQKRLEVKVQHTNKLEAVGQLAAGIAHEINTPIQFVGDSVGFAREATDQLLELVELYDKTLEVLPDGTVTDEAWEAIDDLREDADIEFLQKQLPLSFNRAGEGLARIAKIVRAMKEFSRRDEVLEMKNASLEEGLQSTLVVAQNEYRYVADIEESYDDLPPVRCNLGDLNQVFLNLIVNASHAIADKIGFRPESRGTITVKTYRDGDVAVVEIGDTGDGIPPHLHERIFEPFFTTKEVGRGSGQGLAISHTIVVDKHKGQLSFETEQGVGTTFFIRLPIQGADLMSSRS